MTKKALFLAGLLGVSSVFGEGEVGSFAYHWSGYSDGAPSPTNYSLGAYHGKVVLQVVFQFDCGGCNANAPKFGRLVDTLDRGPDSAKFQAVGLEIKNGTYTQIQNQYANNLKMGGLNINFPLVRVPYDSAISGKPGDPVDNIGTKWKRYNSYRDVYFVINHEGYITARIEGNRSNAMSTVKYDSLRAALNLALAAVPAGVAPGGNLASGFRVERAGRGFYFRMNEAFSGDITLKISNLRGRTVRTLTITSADPHAYWNGLDASGSPLPYGMYFLQVSGGGLSLRRSVPLLP